MGLLDLAGLGDTQFGQYFAQNPNFIGSVGAGFGSGRNFGEGLSRAAQLAPQGRSLDVAAAAQREEKAQERQRINQTLQLMQRDYPDLAQMFEGGTPEIQSGAVSEMFRRMGQANGGGPELTANQRDFMFSQEHPEFADFLGRGDDSSSIGTIPQGHELIVGEDGQRMLRAIPGGPTAIEQQEDAQRRSTSYERADNTSAMAISAIDNALEATNFLTTGPVGSAGRWVGATPNLELEGYLNTVKAQLGFEQLQAMREASPTGGALGQVTERELTFLQSVVESLDARYGEENIDQRLGVVRNLIQRNRVYRQLEAAGITDLNDPVAQEALARFPLPAGTALPALPSGPGSQPNGNTTSTNIQYRILD